MSRLEAIVARIRERFPDVLREAATTPLGEDQVVVSPEGLVEVATLLRDDPELRYELLADLSAVDWLPREPRFEVNCHLYSLAHHHRLRVKVRLPGDNPVMPSLTGVWPGADWHEREAYDLFGIVFTGHPNLRRILMPDDWIGHPLRKDYPVGGVPVEYRIEPAYVGEEVVSEAGRPSAGGLPPRLVRDRGARSAWTWTGPPATGVRIPEPPRPPGGGPGEGEGGEG